MSNQKYEFIGLESNNGIAFSKWLNNETGKFEFVILDEILNPDEKKEIGE